MRAPLILERPGQDDSLRHVLAYMEYTDFNALRGTSRVHRDRATDCLVPLSRWIRSRGSRLNISTGVFTILRGDLSCPAGGHQLSLKARGALKAEDCKKIVASLNGSSPPAWTPSCCRTCCAMAVDPSYCTLATASMQYGVDPETVQRLCGEVPAPAHGCRGYKRAEVKAVKMLVGAKGRSQERTRPVVEVIIKLLAASSRRVNTRAVHNAVQTTCGAKLKTLVGMDLASWMAQEPLNGYLKHDVESNTVELCPPLPGSCPIPPNGASEEAWTGFLANLVSEAACRIEPRLSQVHYLELSLQDKTVELAPGVFGGRASGVSGHVGISKLVDDDFLAILGDQRRLIAYFEPPVEVVDVIKQAAADVGCSGWIPRWFSRIRSYGGGRRQLVHTDYSREACRRLEAAHKTKPASFLLALQDGTRLHVWTRDGRELILTPSFHRLGVTISSL